MMNDEIRWTMLQTQLTETQLRALAILGDSDIKPNARHLAAVAIVSSIPDKLLDELASFFNGEPTSATNERRRLMVQVMTVDPETDIAKLLGLTGGLTAKQREIVRGVIDVLVSIDDEASAMRWLDRNRKRLLDEIERAGGSG